MVELQHKFEDSFFKEEIRCGFQIDKNRKEIWAIELDLLYELDRVCKELGLEYFLAYGTLIGAVRDNHFIPWDDDIDVCMMRADYDILVKEGLNRFCFPYFLQTGYNDHSYFRGHAQLRNSMTCGALPSEFDVVDFNQGIFIDIFPLDNIHEERLYRQYRKKRFLVKNRNAIVYPNRGSFLKRIPKKILKYIMKNTKTLYKVYDNTFKDTPYSDFVDILMFKNEVSQVKKLEREWYNKSILIKFEDGFFPVPIGYDKILKMQYGEDYIIPRNIVNTHNKNGNVIFDVNLSYKEKLAQKNN